ncbi:hypothetical protein [Phenylobacterium sp.]|uniref:hypothetical protein n=1 Tax=Phenylobacterium sp. TaxID=1871053 RepID=UPI003BAD8BAC
MSEDRPAVTARGLVSLAVALCGIGSILGLMVYAQLQRPKLDEKGCPVGGATGALTVMVVDQSDPFERADREEIHDRVRRWRLASQLHDRFMLVVPRTSNPFEPDIRFDRCAPQNPETANRMIVTTSKLDEPWRVFAEAQDREIKRVAAEQSAIATPLLETLVAIAREPVFRGATQRRIVLLSDLMQNSEAANFYRRVPAVPDMEAAGLAPPASLTGAEVEIHYAARHTARVRNPAVMAFWRKWFSVRKAEIKELVE